MLSQTLKIHCQSNYRDSTAPIRNCSVCGSKALGANFGALTCAPCKAFFRRNARRKEVLQIQCQHIDLDHSRDQCHDNMSICSELRHCTTCRLRRCFEVGMNANLVRSDEEKQRYKQMILANRQRRRSSSRLLTCKAPQIAEAIPSDNALLKEKDWRLLSKIVDAYENYCLKIFIEKRKNIINNEINFDNKPSANINHYKEVCLNNIKSFLSFLLSIPTVQSLSTNDRYYLFKHNIRSLILPNFHEIEQTCFSESWQVNMDNAATEFIFGKILFDDFVQIKKKAKSVLIADPVVTRLWLITLFFSTPLLCLYDRSLPNISKENRLDINKIQNSFTTLLWNYLSHRHGCFDAIRIFSNLIYIYLQMQRISQAMNHEVQMRNDLVDMNQAFNQAIAFESDMEQFEQIDY
ncbi:unnamed protein product [Rotaria magnacalcarata]|uniref:Nuclear receptor domain-containing protein n=1 Tax=Rotaria magnacalcarata TaxID=392030 RepID=A0A819S7H4_9BILA|nr:unnamed protein product [Rotaria magnacalcarata]CAF4057421.1 unnamed protein product [Rotaria magnacalcarata]